MPIFTGAVFAGNLLRQIVVTDGLFSPRKRLLLYVGCARTISELPLEASGLACGSASLKWRAMLATMHGSLEEVRRQVEKCRSCSLWQTRTKAVPGEGATGGLMLVGEAPGRDEDLQGRPFVGRAGKLLESFLSAAGLSREGVYITNAVKCRPPGNRRPKSEEIAACRLYLLEEIELVRPSAVLMMGSSAAYALLGKRSVVSLRKKEFTVQGVPARVTFHPAAMLRNPALRSYFMEDLLAILHLMSTKGTQN